jgi:hypothetical protein
MKARSSLVGLILFLKIPAVAYAQTDDDYLRYICGESLYGTQTKFLEAYNKRIMETITRLSPKEGMSDFECGDRTSSPVIVDSGNNSRWRDSGSVSLVLKNCSFRLNSGDRVLINPQTSLNANPYHQTVMIAQVSCRYETIESFDNLGRRTGTTKRAVIANFQFNSDVGIALSTDRDFAHIQFNDLSYPEPKLRNF